MTYVAVAVPKHSSLEKKANAEIGLSMEEALTKLIKLMKDKDEEMYGYEKKYSLYPKGDYDFFLGLSGYDLKKIYLIPSNQDELEEYLDYKRKLEKLDKALEENVLSKAEYEEKRSQLGEAKTFIPKLGFKFA